MSLAFSVRLLTKLVLLVVVFFFVDYQFKEIFSLLVFEEKKSQISSIYFLSNSLSLSLKDKKYVNAWHVICIFGEASARLELVFSVTSES